MKVLNLRCTNGHDFEGWFGSEDDFAQQNGRHDIACPMCADTSIRRMPSAPRLNLSGAREVVPLGPPPQAEPAVTVQAQDLQAAWLSTVRQLMAKTEDVGPRFAEEARRIHYGETPHRGIRGEATAEEREALRDEGIETMAIPMPRLFEGPLQ
ncbi:MAG: DUF1178 family protein [Burkholderiales bacterium]|nr:DUF1178 family protein [Burkholderiales bacterium]MDE1927876.1 DUF1178 family protein [Burkholderiales bacterium]MDE2160284.1 DUF1178 family protein [Burkholderiales bacterium]MDE2504543.1 DUF1178 family protein [Burkholderiales bacterium]